MKFTIVASPSAKHQQAHQLALANGLAEHGIDSVLTNSMHVDTKHVACWGWRQGKALRDAGHEVLVMERGYLGDRFAYTSLAWNGLNGHGDFGIVGNDASRLTQEIKPWKDGGFYVLILGQVPGDASILGLDMAGIYEDIAYKCKQTYGIDVFFRPHPDAAKRGGFYPRIPFLGGTLEEALNGASVAISYNSNSLVDAVMAGVPSVAINRGTMAWDVCAHEVGAIARPDRYDWAVRLANSQWALDEINNGKALCGLLTAVE